MAAAGGGGGGCGGAGSGGGGAGTLFAPPWLPPAAAAPRLPRVGAPGLPGTTCFTRDYHYAGCGCDAVHHAGGGVDWIWTPAAVRRVAAHVARAPPRLRVAYLLPHHNVTGGMKMLVAHMRHLRRRGHWVAAAYRGPPGTPVLPPWAAHEVVDASLLLPPHAPLEALLGTVDVVVAGYFTQLAGVAHAPACPGAVVYWEQGHEHLFGDPTASAAWDAVFHRAMHAPVALLAVSHVVRDILARHFGRVAPLVPNAIDLHDWEAPAASAAAPLAAPLGVSGAAPLAAPLAAPVATPLAAPVATPLPAALPPAAPSSPPFRVLLVGNPALPLKNHATALAALDAAARRLAPHRALAVTWVCQVPLLLQPRCFALTLVVNPPQEHLPAVFSGHHALLFPSVYEAWGMPVLEAMAAGVAVVTAACRGVDTFCTHGHNCIMVPPYDADAMAAALVEVATHAPLAAALARAGRATAARHTWDAAMDALERALVQVHFTIGAGAPALAAATTDAMTAPWEPHTPPLLLPSDPSPLPLHPPLPLLPLLFPIPGVPAACLPATAAAAAMPGPPPPPPPPESHVPMMMPSDLAATRSDAPLPLRLAAAAAAAAAAPAAAAALKH